MGLSPRRPVQRLLDREHGRVLRRLRDEGLDRRGEGVVGVVDEHVALAQHREEVRRARSPRVGEPRRRHRRPRLAVQVRTVERVDAPQRRRGRAARSTGRRRRARPRARGPGGRACPRCMSASISRRSGLARTGAGAAPSRRRPTGRRPRPPRGRGRRCASPGRRSAPRSSCPGTASPRWAAMTCSSGTKRSPSGMTTKRGSVGRDLDPRDSAFAPRPGPAPRPPG